jgi:hypothetical protein
MTVIGHAVLKTLRVIRAMVEIVLITRASVEVVDPLNTCSDDCHVELLFAETIRRFQPSKVRRRINKEA